MKTQLKLCDKILDTLKTDDDNIPEYLKLQKGLALIFSGNEFDGNKLLIKLFKQKNLPPAAGGIYPYLNKSRKELIKTWLGEND